MSPTLRLSLALSTSGLVLTAFAGGPWAVWPAAILWAVPALTAARCLPLAVGFPIAFVVGALGRAFAFHAVLSADDVIRAPVLASAALVPALLIDRLTSTWLPRTGFLAWPFAVVVTVAAVPSDIAPLIAPMPAMTSLAHIEGLAGTAAAMVVVGVLAQAIAGLAATLSWRVPDPFPVAERERGVRILNISALPIAGALVTLTLLNDRLGAPATRSPSTDVPMGVGALVVVVVIVAAIAARMSAGRKSQVA